MRLKDFLNEKETEKFQELQLELLEAHCKKERLMIQAEIDELISLAQSRYDSLMNGNKEQASTFELVRKSPFVRFHSKEEHIMQ